MEAVPKIYLSDLVVLVDDGGEESFYLVVEVNEPRGEVAKVKKSTMEICRMLDANLLAKRGRWEFIEITDVLLMRNALNRLAAVVSMDVSTATLRLARAGGSEPRLEPVPRRRSVVD